MRPQPSGRPLDIPKGEVMSRIKVVGLGALLSLVCAACADPVQIVQPGAAGAAPGGAPARASAQAVTAERTVVLTNGSGSCGIGALVNCFT
jgi:hypothetical protein